MNTQGEQKHFIVFEPSGLRGPINEGKTIMEAAQDIGVGLQNVCGGQAQCGKCKVWIEEGGPKQLGMRAAPGAIEVVRIDPATKEVKFKVIGKTGWKTEQKGMQAKGICGSGIIDAVAEMFSAGVLEKSGRLANGLDTPRLRLTYNGPAFVIAWTHGTASHKDIVICQGTEKEKIKL